MPFVRDPSNLVSYSGIYYLLLLTILTDRVGKARKFLQEKEGKPGIKARKATKVSIINLEDFVKAGDLILQEPAKIATKEV